jgi:hypothetical protein
MDRDNLVKLKMLKGKAQRAAKAAEAEKLAELAAAKKAAAKAG